MSAPGTPAARPSPFLDASRRMALRALPLVAFAALWQIGSSLNLINPSFLPSVASIGVALGDLVHGGEIRDNLFISLFRAYAGLLAGVVVGISLGVGMARSEQVHRFFAPLIGTTYSLPKSSIVPLFILWFGVGNVTDILAVFLACLLPVVVHAYHGVKDAPSILIWSARAMGTSERKLLWRVLLPSALPAILTGVRIALGFSYVLTISAEMIAAKNGIGKLIFLYGENGAYDYMFAALATVVAAAFVSDQLFLWFMNAALRWQDTASARSEA